MLGRMLQYVYHTDQSILRTTSQSQSGHTGPLHTVIITLSPQFGKGLPQNDCLDNPMVSMLAHTH